MKKNNYTNMSKIESLQSLRAIAFLGVFLSHCGPLCFNAMGRFGVSIFLVLSGFVLTYRYYYVADTYEVSIKNNILFGIRKVAKLYPLHILMSILSLFLKYLSVSCNLAYIYLHRNEIKQTRKIFSVLEMIAFFTIGIIQLLYFFKIYPFNIEWFEYTLPFIPISVMFVYLFAVNEGIVSKILTQNKCAVFLGNISSYAFLIHFYVIRLLRENFSSFQEPNLYNIIIILLLTILLSSVFLWLEKVNKIKVK